MNNIKRIFWSGLKAFVPIALTLGIVIWLLDSLEHFFGQIIQHVIPAQYYFKGLGIFLGIVFIFAVGLLVNAWMIKWVYDLTDKLAKKIPVIKTIYNAIQDFVNFFDKSGKSDEQQAVMVDLPMGKVLGFVTRTSMQGLPIEEEVNDTVLVYIPLSYQIGGLAVFMPRSSLIPVKWPADQVMSFILTAGMTSQSNEKKS